MSAPDWNLARRAVACPRWRWMPGMLLDAHERLVGIDPEGIPYGHSHTAGHRVWLDERSLPNLTDPATLGCLLALVREAHDAPAAYLMGSVTKQWVVHHFAEPEAYWKPLTKWQSSEAEALVAALEAAP